MNHFLNHNLALVQKAAGHSSVRTTMGYVHLVDDDLSALVAPPTPPAAVMIDLKEEVARGRLTTSPVPALTPVPEIAATVPGVRLSVTTACDPAPCRDGRYVAL